MEKSTKTVFNGVFLIVLLCSFFQIASASPAEYLYPDESFGTYSLFDIDGEEYYVYNISSPELTVFVCSADCHYTGAEIEKDALFSYFTQKYIQTHQEEITNHYHTTYNVFYDYGDTLGQKILNVFKALEEVCFQIPDFNFVSFCIQPSDDLEIVRTGIVGTRIDWDKTLANYKTLGGEVLYLYYTGNEEVKASEIESVYMHLTSTKKFLESAKQITGDSFPSSKIVDPERIKSESLTKTTTAISQMNARVKELSQEETLLISECNNKLLDIKSVNEDVLRLNYDIDTIESKRLKIENSLKSVKIDDSRFISDISRLENLSTELENLITESEDNLKNAQDTYESKNFFSKKWSDIWGGLRAWVY